MEYLIFLSLADEPDLGQELFESGELPFSEIKQLIHDLKHPKNSDIEQTNFRFIKAEYWLNPDGEDPDMNEQPALCIVIHLELKEGVFLSGLWAPESWEPARERVWKRAQEIRQKEEDN